jgi:hypothetical protein
MAGILAPPNAQQQPGGACRSSSSSSSSSSSTGSGRDSGTRSSRLQPVLGGQRRRGAGAVPLLLASGTPGVAPAAAGQGASAPEVVLPLRLEQQPGALQRIEAAVAVLRLLARRGVAIRDDTGLAAALQALRLCRHGGEAHTSGRA